MGACLRANMMYYHIYLYHGNKCNYHCVITQTLQNGQTLGQFFELLYSIPSDLLAQSPPEYHFFGQSLRVGKNSPTQFHFIRALSLSLVHVKVIFSQISLQGFAY